MPPSRQRVPAVDKGWELRRDVTWLRLVTCCSKARAHSGPCIPSCCCLGAANLRWGAAQGPEEGSGGRGEGREGFLCLPGSPQTSLPLGSFRK